jgi:hypothetical protein
MTLPLSDSRWSWFTVLKRPVLMPELALNVAIITVYDYTCISHTELVGLLTYTPVQKMEAVYSSETLVSIYQISRCITQKTTI